jgi:hypothetical protein
VLAALAAGVALGLCGAASAQAAVEDDVALLHATGTVYSAIDDETGAYEYTLTTDDGASVHFSDWYKGAVKERPTVDATFEIPSGLAAEVGVGPGEVVEIDSEIGEAILVAGSAYSVRSIINAPSARRTPVAPSGPATMHVIDVAIVTGGPDGAPGAPSVATIKAAIAQASTYWADGTNGGLTGFVANTTIKTYTTSKTCAEGEYEFLDEASQKFGYDGRDAGYFNARHLLVITPSTCDLLSWGLGSVGEDATSNGWLTMPARSTGYVATLIHELGHNIGLLHADLRADPCSSTERWREPVCSGDYEYFDLYSPMALDFIVGSGSTATPALDAAHRAYFGFPASYLATAPANVATSYTLKSVESTSGLRAIRIKEPGTGRILYVEYRDGSQTSTAPMLGGGHFGMDPDKNGQLCSEPSDGCLDGWGYGMGVRVVEALPGGYGVTEEFEGDTSAIPVPTSSTIPGFRELALEGGESYRTSSGGALVEVISTSGSTATLRVTVGTPLTAITAKTPTISGIAKQGQTLKAAPGTWTPAPVAFSYQWYRGTSAIGGATSAGYKLSAADVGATIKVKVTGAKSGFPNVSKTSAVTATVIGVLSPTPAPTISGTTSVGQTLALSPGTWGPTPVALTYQWYRSGSTAVIGTAATYRLVPTDLGTTISVKVTGTKSGYESATKTSAATVVVTAGALSAPVPTISGTARLGQVLTAVPGTWGPGAVGLTYQWYRGTAAIAGATATTYKLVAADVGKAISVRVTGAKTGYATTSKKSAATPPVLDVLTATPVPTITGTAKVGQKLTAKPGSWGPAPVALTYHWYRSGSTISGATSTTYTLAAADLGKTITVKVTGTRTGYASASKTSVATSAIVAGTLSATPVPTIAGTAKVGQTLTAAAGGWSPAPVALAYQWYRSGSTISGATSATYILAAADLGKKITVKVTGSKSGFSLASTTSVATAAVIAGTLTATPVPTISGTPSVGAALSAEPGAWGPAPVALSYQWLRGGTVISGATTVAYTPIETDEGQQISVRVTGTKAGYTTLSRTSATVSVGPALILPPDLAVVGAELTRDGTTWVPHGVNKPGLEYACVQGWQPADVSGAEAWEMVAWGIDVVRIPLNQDCWLGVDGAPVTGAFGFEDSTAYRAKVQQWVDAFHEAGLAVILDLHWSAPEGELADGQHRMADRDQSLTFWASVAETYAGEPAVMFEAFNEPYNWTSTVDPDGLTWDCWLDGGCEVSVSSQDTPDAPSETTYAVAGMQEIVDAIRGAGATQPIIVGGNDYANDLSGWLAHRPEDPLTEDQIVAGWHHYAGQACWTSGDCDATIAAVQSEVPVLITEFGWSDSAEGSFESIMDWADAQEIGYLAWAWWDVMADPETPSSLYSLYTGDFLPKSPAGTAFKEHLAGL